MELAVDLGKVKHCGEALSKNYNMQNTSKHLPTPKHRIHQSNLVLHREMLATGLVGPRHSEIINRLLKRTKDPPDTQNPLKSTLTNGPTSEVANSLKQRIQDLEREENNLKREMLRMSELSKSHKNSKIAMEIKYNSLLSELEKKQAYIEELEQKIKVGTELNSYLLKITENVLSVLPHYENNCEDLQNYISAAKNQLQNKADWKTTDNQAISTILDDLCQRLDAFKGEIEHMQAYQNKMMNNLADTHLETRTLSERLSRITNFNTDEVISFKRELSNIHDLFQSQDHHVNDSGQESETERPLSLASGVCQVTFLPEKGPRINKIFSEVSMLFEQHIHLLQNQKMEYQFTKNKKLITCQKFECEICESYEKIVSQTFSIVREAFKEIKFQFLREIKQISDVSEIPILI